jgi:hypothetical protein
MPGTGEMLGIKETLPCLVREIRDMSQNSPSRLGGTETLGRANKVVGKQTGHQTRQDAESRISSSLVVPKPSGMSSSMTAQLWLGILVGW